MRLLPVITGAIVAGSALAPAAGHTAFRSSPPTGTHETHPARAITGIAGIRLAPATNTGIADIRLAPATHTGVADPADIHFDPATNTGFIGAEEVRTAFGWDGAGLVRNAPQISFTYHVGKAATYAVTCEGGVRAEVAHNPGSTSAGLDAVVAWKTAGRTLTGFRITGASSGASSMDVAPEPGLPCPEERGGEIRKAEYLSTTVTTGLSAEFGDVQVYFPQERTVTTTPPQP